MAVEASTGPAAGWDASGPVARAAAPTWPEAPTARPPPPSDSHPASTEVYSAAQR